MAKGKFEYWLTPDGLLLLEGWARDGLIDGQIASNMGISVRTLYEYKERYPQIMQSLKRGKDVIDVQVENALLKRALGYEHVEEKIEIETNATGKLKSRKVVQVVKAVVPDTTAQIFWLKNRRPDKWRDKPTTTEVDSLEKLDGLMKEFRDAIKSETD